MIFSKQFPLTECFEEEGEGGIAIAQKGFSLVALMDMSGQILTYFWDGGMDFGE